MKRTPAMQRAAAGLVGFFVFGVCGSVCQPAYRGSFAEAHLCPAAPRSRYLTSRDAPRGTRVAVARLARLLGDVQAIRRWQDR
jgi:hypothetical protein